MEGEVVDSRPAVCVIYQYIYVFFLFFQLQYRAMNLYWMAMINIEIYNPYIYGHTRVKPQIFEWGQLPSLNNLGLLKVLENIWVFI